MKTRTTNRHTPAAEPKLTNEEQRKRKTRYSILVDSELNRAMWRVKQAAEELESMIEAFEDARDRDMTEVQIANHGLDENVPENEEWMLDWADEAAQDVMGFKWGLTIFKDLLRTLGKRPADLDEAEAEEPAIVTT